jgi:Ca2+-transporting ATPase
MDEPPKKKGEAIVNKKDWMTITIYAVAMTAAVILAVVYGKYFLNASEHDLNNVAFITLTITQLLHVFNMSSLKSSLFLNEITRNHFIWLALALCLGLLALVFIVPSLRSALELELIPAPQWITCFVVSCFPLIGLQLYHYISRKKSVAK